MLSGELDKEWANTEVQHVSRFKRASRNQID